VHAEGKIVTNKSRANNRYLADADDDKMMMMMHPCSHSYTETGRERASTKIR